MADLVSTGSFTVFPESAGVAMSSALCRKTTFTSGVTTIRTRQSSCGEDVPASGWTAQRTNLAGASGKIVPIRQESKIDPLIRFSFLRSAWERSVRRSASCETGTQSVRCCVPTLERRNEWHESRTHSSSSSAAHDHRILSGNTGDLTSSPLFQRAAQTSQGSGVRTKSRLSVANVGSRKFRETERG